MTETDKQRDRAAAQMGLCPVCKQGPVRSDADGLQAHCENHTPFLFLERDHETEPWRLVEPDR